MFNVMHLGRVDTGQQGQGWSWVHKYSMGVGMAPPTPQTRHYPTLPLNTIFVALRLAGSTAVDLSSNEIRHLESLAQFQNVRSIDVSKNKITNCKGKRVQL